MMDATTDTVVNRWIWRLDGSGPARVAANAVLTLTLTLTLAVGLGVLAPGGAQAAAFEEVKTCAASGEGAVVEEAKAIAVDDATGDVYVANGSQRRVTRFNSKCEFLEAWGWGVANHASEFQTCGKAAFEAHEAKFATCEASGVRNVVESGAFGTPNAIAVNQETGNVYVGDFERHAGVIQEFNGDGEHLVASFGERTNSHEVIEVGHPERFNSPENVAVGDKGTVFITDYLGGHELAEGRVVVFAPKTSADEEYIYQQEFGKGHSPRQVGLDLAGDVFISNETEVSKFAAGSFNSSACNFHQSSEFEGMASEPTSGGVFAFSGKKDLFVELNTSCEKIAGTEFPGITGERSTEGLAYSPTQSWGPGRHAGILYGVDEALKEVLVFAPPATIPKEPPIIEGESVLGVESLRAELQGVIDPRGHATEYRFEYGPVGADCSLPGECHNTPVETIASGGSGVAIPPTVVGGLLPGTAYRFRISAWSHCNPEIPSEECKAERKPDVKEYVDFNTYDAVARGLPDGRAFELVSPPDKKGGEVFETSPFLGDCAECLPGLNDQMFPMVSAPDGNEIAYEGYPFSNEGAVNENEYLSEREAGGGWSTRDLSPKSERREVGAGAGYKGFASDLSDEVLYQSMEPSLSPEAPAEYPNLYLQASSNPSVLRPLVTRQPPARGKAEEGTNQDQLRLGFAGASSDYSQVIFQANDALTDESGVAPAAPSISKEGAEAGSAHDLYEWSDGALKLVNVLPGNAQASASAVLGSGLELATKAGDPDYSHAISDKGSRIYWTDEKEHHIHVYVREDGEKTVFVKDSEEGRFVTASADGSKTLLSDGHIFDVAKEDAVTHSPEEVADLTQGQGGFVGILGASEDLSRIYFIDTAAFSAKAKEEDELKKEDHNLYLWENGSVTFITVLTGAGDGQHGLPGGYVSDWAASPSDRTAEVTPSGEYAAFMSSSPLTGYDNGAFFEVFEYDAVTHRLACASCNPTLTRPLGDSSLNLIVPGAGGGTLQQPHNLLADGRLFFDSFDSLSPYDTNGGHEDVYEYEAVGTGSCSAAQATPGQEGLKGEGGCVMLISSGSEGVDSSFIDANPDGSDAFFVTRTQLVAQDGDELLDLYDAREPHEGRPKEVEKGEEGEKEGKGEGEGEGEGEGGGECSSPAECRPPTSSSSASEAAGAPSSTTPFGSGNLVSPVATNPPLVKPPLTRAQKLARALKLCGKQKSRKARKACEAKARKLYGPKVKRKAKKGSHR